jgi:hypothetical protein
VNSWQRRSGVVFLLVAAVVLQQSIWELGLFEPDGQPGAGFMPFGLGVVLAALSVLLIVKYRARDARHVPFWEGRAWLHPLVAVLITIAYIFLFDDVGAMTSVAVLVTGWLLLVGKKSVLVSVGTGLATALVVYVVFDRLLSSPFPRGILF